MKWVFLAIALILVPYTFIRLKYSKVSIEKGNSTPGYRPYEDSKNRANVMRLLEAKFQRVSIDADRPADPVRFGPLARSTPADFAGGLPNGLADTLVEPPLLPAKFTSVQATSETAIGAPYKVAVTCVSPNHKEQLGGAEVYLRDDTITIVPRFERVGGELLTRSTETPVVLTIPANTLKAGRYTVTLAASQQSKQWTLDVR